MIEIKTRIGKIDFPEAFDMVVNTDIEAGWSLKRRDIINHTADGYPLLYAELERGAAPVVERRCENCKYEKLPSASEPCRICYNKDHWEPAT